MQFKNKFTNIYFFNFALFNFRCFCSKKIVLLFYTVLITWVVVVISIFMKFSTLSYGVTPLSAMDVLRLKWSNEWDFIIHKM